jgi:hypothetical protein
MDEREIEKGYADFHRRLNRILRTRNVKTFKAHIASHPGQAGRLSHCLGLNDELAEIEMYKAILIRPALKALHKEALWWFKDRGIEPPALKTNRGRKRSS